MEHFGRFLHRLSNQFSAVGGGHKLEINYMATQLEFGHQESYTGADFAIYFNLCLVAEFANLTSLSSE